MFAEERAPQQQHYRSTNTVHLFAHNGTVTLTVSSQFAFGVSDVPDCRCDGSNALSENRVREGYYHLTMNCVTALMASHNTSITISP
jgi:hypothetical protein